MSKKWRFLLLLLIGLSRGSFAQDLKMTMSSFGPVTTGMKASQAYHQLKKIFGNKVSSPASALDNSDCEYYLPIHGLAIMMREGKVTRFEVGSRQVITFSGIKVGDTVAKVKTLMGPRLSDEPQFYDGPEARTLTQISGDGKYAIRFEIYDGKVKEIYSGYESSIHLVEGCS